MIILLTLVHSARRGFAVAAILMVILCGIAQTKVSVLAMPLVMVTVTAQSLSLVMIGLSVGLVTIIKHRNSFIRCCMWGGKTNSDRIEQVYLLVRRVSDLSLPDLSLEKNVHSSSHIK